MTLTEPTRKRLAAPELLASFGHNKRLVLGTVILTLIVLAAIFAPLLAPYHPFAQNLQSRLQPPSGMFLLGTDHLGRDTLTRLIYGFQPSLVSGLAAVSLACVAGTFLGVLTGYFGGVIDAVIGRAFDLLVAWPAIFIALGLILVMGPGPLGVVIAIGLSELPIFGRVARAVTISTKSATFVEAAQSMEASDWRIMRKHILPYIFPHLVVQFAIGAPQAVVAEAALSFLGLGSQPPFPSLGAMVSDAQLYLSQSLYVAIFPIVAIGLLVFALTLIADGLQDLLNPRLRRSAK